MTNRKSWLALCGLAACGSVALADELGTVISSTPVVQQVAIPRQVCSTEPMLVQAPKTGAGAVMGAIAGGVVGNAVGQGGGRAVATLLGVIGGAALGDQIEGAPSQVQNVQQCTTQTFYENRPTSWTVVYEYAGKQYTVQMPNDPGATVRLRVAPVIEGTDQTSQALAGASVQQPVLQQPVYRAAPVYAPSPYYYPQPYYYYPPVGISLNLGFGRGHGGRGHWR